jgi:hypothetical protein
VNQGNTSINDDFAFKPINRPAVTATVRTPPVAAQPPAPPQVVKGEKGDKGDPGEITAEQIDQISSAVTNALLPQVLARLKTDDSFRGENGLAGKDGANGRDGRDGESPDVATIVQAVQQQMPKIDVNAIANAAAAQVDEDAIAEKVAGKIDLAKIASMVKIDMPDVVSHEPASRDYVYITAKGNPSLESLDNQIYALKKAGVPIVVVRLDPRDTKVNDVPKLFDGNKKQTVSGHDNVVQYVSTLAVPTSK